MKSRLNDTNATTQPLKRIDGTPSADRPESIEDVYNLGARLKALRVIGTGGMGTVLEVYHRELATRRAVKLIDRKLLHESNQVFSRFRQEALIASEISHPNIVKVYDLDRTPNGSPFMLMELLEGMDLEAVIQQKSPLSLSAVIRLLAGPADALDAVHRKSVIHRDLKPANLFLTNSGSVKILDFGISSFGSFTRDARITRDGEVVGTPLYMSPEQLTGQPLDGRADIYSLGIIAYELLTGQPIFPFDNLQQLTTTILTGAPAPPTRLNPQLPVFLDAVFEKVFKKEPHQRFATAIEFINALAGEKYRHLISTVIHREIISAIDSSAFRITSHEPDAISSTETDHRSSAAMAVPGAVAQNRTHTAAPSSPGGQGTIRSLNRSTGVLKFFKRRQIAFWLFLSLIVAALTAFATLKSAPAPRSIQVILEPLSLKTQFKDDIDWEEQAINSVFQRYVALTPHVRTVTGESRGTDSGSASNTLNLRLNLMVHHDSQWHTTLRVLSDDATPMHEFRCSTDGFEAGIEKVTWDFVMFTDTQLNSANPTLSLSAKTDNAEQTHRITRALMNMAVDALKNSASAQRVDRLAALMPPSKEKQFVTAFQKYLECVVGNSPEFCAREEPFIPYQPTVNSELNHIWKHLASASSGQQNCNVFDSPLPDMGFLIPLMPGKAACPEMKKNICTTMNTFWDRYDCALESTHRDAPGTTLAYIFEGLKKDDGDRFYAGLNIMFEKGMGTPEGNQWLQRMTARYGKNDSALAGLQFAREMTQRHTDAALIWSRRAKRPVQKNALALLASGWLTEGARTYLDFYQRIVEETQSRDTQNRDTQNRNTASTHQILRHAMLPVLLSHDPELATRWLEKAQDISPAQPLLTEAITLVKAVATEDRRSLCATRDQQHFAIEADYICDRHSKIIQNTWVTFDTAHVDAMAAFFLAEAYMAKQRLTDARKLYEKLESQTFFRINFPTLSIISLKRLGDVAQSLGDANAATEWYQKYLAAWEALDIPIADYIDAVRFVTNR